MTTTKCDSAAHFKQQVDPIRGQISLTETEESWDTIARGISNLKGLCDNGACDYPSEVTTVMRGLSRALNSAMNSARTKLSGAAIDLISSVASGLGPTFEPLLHLFFPSLLTLCTRSNKVFITRARTCIQTIIENTQLLPVLTYLTQSLKDKSVSLRLAASEGVLACMNCFNPPDLEKEARAREIESVIRVTAKDASADIRKTSRKIFEAYKVLLPNRVDNFTSPLSPTMKKYLDIKSMNQPQQSLRLQKSHSALSDLAKHQLSSSTSALQNRSSKSTSEHTITHARSASSSASTIVTTSRQVDVVNPELSRGKTHNGHQPQASRGQKDMPPPEFIPVRSVHPPSRALAASRTTSNLESHKSIISVSSVAPTRSLTGGIPHDPLPVSSQPARITPASSVGAAPVGAQRLTAPQVAAGVSIGPTRPQRPVALTSSSDACPPAPEPMVSGARRVPRPEPIQKEEVSEKTKGTRPASRNDSAMPTRPATRPDLSTKSTKSAQPNTLSKSTAEKASTVPKATFAAAGPARNAVVKTRGVNQPTLSQPVKPLWGRSAPGPVPRKARTKPLSLKKKGGDKPVVIPEAVPLPPSPGCAPLEVPLPSTPISTLLTSIQRGFIFTPSSPLSPPQSYLPRSAVIPFPLQGMMGGEMGFGIGFEFGTQKIMAGEEVGRVVLNDVEVNKLAD